MSRDQIIATLRAHESQLRRRGVSHVALFGSAARGEAKPASDIDIMIELEPDAPIGLFEYVAYPISWRPFSEPGGRGESRQAETAGAAASGTT